MLTIRRDARPLIAGALLALLLTTTGCGRAEVMLPAATPPPVGPTPARAATTTPVPTSALSTLPTDTPAPTPTLPPPPADPFDLFNPFAFVDTSDGTVLEKSDQVDLDGKAPNEALLTVSSPPVVSGTNPLPVVTLGYTNTLASLAVFSYDAPTQKWSIKYQTPNGGVPGRAAPLPASAQGQNLLKMDPPLPVLQLRTETTPTLGSSVPVINLRLYGWKDGTAHPLPMRPAGATADQDSLFAGSDAQLIDVDGDGRAEVVVQDGTKTTIWKWDGARFVPR